MKTSKIDVKRIEREEKQSPNAQESPADDPLKLAGCVHTRQSKQLRYWPVMWYCILRELEWG